MERGRCPGVRTACPSVLMRGPMSADPLSDVLRVVRLDGAFFYVVEASEPWSVEAVAARDLTPRILPGAEHLISYHILTAGRVLGWIDRRAADGARLGQRDRVPHGRAHMMSSAAGVRRAGDVRRDAGPLSRDGDARRMAGGSRPRSSAGSSAAIGARSTRCWRRCPAACTCPGSPAAGTRRSRSRWSRSRGRAERSATIRRPPSVGRSSGSWACRRAGGNGRARPPRRAVAMPSRPTVPSCRVPGRDRARLRSSLCAVTGIRRCQTPSSDGSSRQHASRAAG